MRRKKKKARGQGAERRYVHKLQERTQKTLTFRKKTQGSYVHKLQ